MFPNMQCEICKRWFQVPLAMGIAHQQSKGQGHYFCCQADCKPPEMAQQKPNRKTSSGIIKKLFKR